MSRDSVPPVYGIFFRDCLWNNIFIQFILPQFIYFFLKWNWRSVHCVTYCDNIMYYSVVHCSILQYTVLNCTKVKSVKWEKCWSSKRPVRLTFHSPPLCFNGFPWTPSIPVWRIFWPSIQMRWQFKERIRAPASLRAGCRKVFLLHSQLYFSAMLYFSAVLHFSAVLYMFSFERKKAFNTIHRPF